jgi:alkylation response protein AidB-like acyl-CoA dehydrogenase
MEFAFTHEQEALRETARAFLAQHSSSAHVRRCMEGELGHDPETWKRMAELGWPALLIPESYGGLGLGFVELAALLELQGEFLLCSPYFATQCLAVPLLLAAASEEQRSELLPPLAAGRRLATLAWSGPAGGESPACVEATARSHAGGFELSGRARYVVDGALADLLLIAARLPGSSGDEGISLFAIDATQPGVVRRALSTLDATRRLAEIELCGAQAPRGSLLGEEGAGAAALGRALDLARIALSAEQVGGAQRCLDMALEHAKSRVQFGRPIGSFQAVKHTCADMFVRVESARSAAYYAACIAGDEAEHDLALAASLAKAACSEAYFQCAADCLQIHGGVGFTWEYDVHLHLKRARAGRSLLGDPASHRERVACRIGL